MIKLLIMKGQLYVVLEHVTIASLSLTVQMVLTMMRAPRLRTIPTMIQLLMMKGQLYVVLEHVTIASLSLTVQMVLTMMRALEMKKVSTMKWTSISTTSLTTTQTARAWPPRALLDDHFGCGCWQTSEGLIWLSMSMIMFL